MQILFFTVVFQVRRKRKDTVNNGYRYTVKYNTILSAADGLGYMYVLYWHLILGCGPGLQFGIQFISLELGYFTVRYSIL